MSVKVCIAIAIAVLVAAPLAAAYAPIRVNAGGAAFTDGSGHVWAADYGYNGGNVFTSTQVVGNALLSKLAG